MSLILSLVIVVVFILLIAYWNYDLDADPRKRFKGYENIIAEPYEMNKDNCIASGPSNWCKTTFIKDFCDLYETVFCIDNVFCIDKKEWKGCNLYGSNDINLLDNISIFANSVNIFDDMGDDIRFLL